MDEPVQLDLFGWKPPKAKAKTEAQPKIDIENLPPYDPNAFHRVYEIKPDGSREWTAIWLSFQPTMPCSCSIATGTACASSTSSRAGM